MSTALHIRCPGCGGGMVPVELRCAGCDLAVRGVFEANEFARLGEEELHFLRIFVLCEGRIKEMESALGVSYPTIKGKLAKLKEALRVGAVVEEKKNEAAAESRTAAILKELGAGQVTFEEAMAKLRIERDRS